MEYLIIAIKLFIALSIFNVWLIRFNKSTTWRGGEASNMKEEFAAYQLPSWFMYLVGFLKVLFGIFLILSIWYPSFEDIGAYGIAILMAGAVSMHLRIADPLKKSFPALSFLVLALIVALA